MDNAHFRLLLDDCENRCIRCDKIRQWVNDRERILVNIMGAHKVAHVMEVVCCSPIDKVDGIGSLYKSK